MDCTATGIVWETLLEKLESECGAGMREWHKYSKNAAPSFGVKRGKRTIVYLLPGEAGVTAALRTYPGGARKCAVGTAARVTVRELVAG